MKHDITEGKSVLDAPVITLHPASASRCEGTSVQLRVTATGENIQYQWLKNGTDLQGATQNLLTLINLKPEHAGVYVCKVYNSDGTVYSNPATLEILTDLAITSQPQSLNLQPGQTAQFSVETSGDVSTYQWYKGNTAIFDGGNISGTQTQTLTIANISQADQGKYFCKIIGPCNQEFSDDAYLSIISSTGELIREQFSWFPNPAKQTIHFKGPDAGLLSLSIYNAHGIEVILKDHPEASDLDISVLKPGYYTIVTTTSNSRSVQKLIIAP